MINSILFLAAMSAVTIDPNPYDETATDASARASSRIDPNPYGEPPENTSEKIMRTPALTITNVKSISRAGLLLSDISIDAVDEHGLPTTYVLTPPRTDETAVHENPIKIDGAVKVEIFPEGDGHASINIVADASITAAEPPQAPTWPIVINNVIAVETDLSLTENAIDIISHPLPYVQRLTRIALGHGFDLKVIEDRAAGQTGLVTIVPKGEGIYAVKYHSAPGAHERLTP